MGEEGLAMKRRLRQAMFVFLCLIVVVVVTILVLASCLIDAMAARGAEAGDGRVAPGFDQQRAFKCQKCSVLLPGGTRTCTDCGCDQLVALLALPLTKVDLVEWFVGRLPMKDRGTVRELRLLWMALLFIAALMAVIAAGVLVAQWLGLGR